MHYTRSSSWIRRIGYTPASKRANLPNGAHGFLLIDIGSHVWAYAVPSYVFGLMMATRARDASVGEFFHRQVKAFPSVDATEVMGTR